MNRNIEIMDTTLRDGEQTSGVSYSPKEKLTIAKLLLEELKINFKGTIRVFIYLRENFS